MTNGMEVKGCECNVNNGVVSQGHCCPLGHTYVDGKCIVAVAQKGTCIYNGNVISETDDYGTAGGKYSSYSASCECKDSTKCMDRSGALPVCGECPSDGT